MLLPLSSVGLFCCSFFCYWTTMCWLLVVVVVVLVGLGIVVIVVTMSWCKTCFWPWNLIGLGRSALTTQPEWWSGGRWSTSTSFRTPQPDRADPDKLRKPSSPNTLYCLGRPGWSSRGDRGDPLRVGTLSLPGEIQKGTGGRGRDRKCHKLSQTVVTFYDDLYDNLWRFMTFYDVLCQWNKEMEIVIKCRKLS